MRGIIAPFVLDGPINRDAFETYVACILVPELRPGDVAVMDNLSGHKGPRVEDMIQAAGARLLFLPAVITSAASGRGNATVALRLAEAPLEHRQPHLAPPPPVLPT